MPKKRCAHCNEYFERDEMIIDRISAYCSLEHHILHINTGRARMAERRRERKRESDVPEDTRRLVLDLDGHRCRYCGQSSNNLVVHHIAYRSEAPHEPWLNDPVNLITLCNYPCHLDIVHKNKEVYQPLCRQIVYLRALKGDKITTIKQLERERNDYQ
jgi:5-methylcytosine-specific restriction endonuclease McrA